MINRLAHVVSRILFVGCLVLAALAVWERGLNVFGFTVLGEALPSSRLLELSAIGVLFVIALELRELIEIAKRARGS